MKMGINNNAKHVYHDQGWLKNGYDSYGQNFYLKPHHEFQKMVLISFKDL